MGHGAITGRHLERRLPVSRLERGQACHPERSEGSGETAAEILRCAQDDRPDLQMSEGWEDGPHATHFWVNLSEMATQFFGNG